MSVRKLNIRKVNIKSFLEPRPCSLKELCFLLDNDPCVVYLSFFFFLNLFVVHILDFAEIKILGLIFLSHLQLEDSVLILEYGQ